ncbi:hypothetical protein MAPG_11134 [Magnaporthiopsis poae ATCC 64411]|uniref:non-specific serine/threonine protein kinase n=1 Tax=Magnaporthiopsis poae (strain ATCC 64411 / 73-15) TaxID=644358 RepID=A0A0C4EEG1_MAGP6|nr:hypothetical protein MAPG_11134 [Magnaporthiopsis poae ATCC 64411]
MAVHTSSTASTAHVLEDIGGDIHGPMPGFIRKYFDRFVSHSPVATAESHPPCSVPLSPDSFPEKFSILSQEELVGARCTWHTANVTSSHIGTTHLLTPSHKFDPLAKHYWLDVQVVGQVCRGSSAGYQAGLIELCGHAQKVFASQPTRLFLHAFYVHELVVELWVFDRSGLYSSEVLKLGADDAQITSILRSYRLMTDQELGINDVVKHDDGGNFITLGNGSAPSPTRLYLQEQPVSLRQALVGMGTVCYKARSPDSDRWDFVVKFKWRWARSQREDEVLLLAGEKHVSNVASLVYYKESVSTADLRSGLRWGPYRRLVTTAEPSTAPQEPGREKGSPDRPRGQKLGSDLKGIAAATEETEMSLRNRIFTCIVLSPAGRPLYTFKTALELLQVFRDAVTGHRSLLQSAGLLHRDVSMGNVIIVDHDQASDAPRGILIDLDSAARLADIPQRSGEIIGTRPFMAIGVLEGRPHTYRHDLEAFLYLFLYTIIANRSDSTPPASKLREWGRRDVAFDDLAAVKMSDMQEDGFASILDEFPREFDSLRSVAGSMQQVLFAPDVDGSLWTGTDSSPAAVDKLYDGMIGVLESGISSVSGV